MSMSNGYKNMSTDEQIRHTLWRYDRAMINFYDMKREMKKLLNRKEK